MTTTYRFPVAPGSTTVYAARNRLETAILDYADAMRTFGALVTKESRAMQERHVKARWDEVERLMDEFEAMHFVESTEAS